MEEHPHVPLCAADEPKPIPERGHDSLLSLAPVLLLLHQPVEVDAGGPPVPVPAVHGQVEDHEVAGEHGVVAHLVFVGVREGHDTVGGREERGRGEEGGRGEGRIKFSMVLQFYHTPRPTRPSQTDRRSVLV